MYNFTSTEIMLAQDCVRLYQLWIIQAEKWKNGEIDEKEVHKAHSNYFEAKGKLCRNHGRRTKLLVETFTWYGIEKKTYKDVFNT